MKKKKKEMKRPERNAFASKKEKGISLQQKMKTQRNMVKESMRNK